MSSQPPDPRRITLISRGNAAPARDWNDSLGAPQRLIFVPAFTVLRYALANGPATMAHDVGRVVIDHAATAAEFLELLTILPPEFAGDVLLVESTLAFLSATGRGGDRVLYSLTPADIGFYLETNDLILEANVRIPHVFQSSHTVSFQPVYAI